MNVRGVNVAGVDRKIGNNRAVDQLKTYNLLNYCVYFIVHIDVVSRAPFTSIT